MQRYGVLVVDDSAVMRKYIGLLIEKDPQLFVAGIARNGIEAIEKVQMLKPDIVTMDIEMPEMDGMTALQEIMKICPVSVIMLSNQTDKDPALAFKAMELGAVDFYLKGQLLSNDAEPEVVKNFLERLKAVAENARKKSESGLLKKTGSESVSKMIGDILKSSETEKEPSTKKIVDLLIIGCSTGGPAALQSILPYFSKDTRVPILVIQHMPPGFTKALAERFDAFCSLRVKEAENGDILEPGKIYIAPAGFQTTLYRRQDGKVGLKVQESFDEKILYKPSVDITLNSAAPIYKERLLAVILTGMGNDGLEGCRAVKRYNGYVIVEAEESCVVYGMPKAVYEAGLADIQVPLPRILNSIMLYI